MFDPIEYASDPAFGLDENLCVTAWNRRAEELFGWTASQAVGRRCYDVLDAKLPDGEPLCGPDCHGGVCFSREVPFGVAECVIPADGRGRVRVALSSLILPPEPATRQRRRTLVFVHPLDRDETLRLLPEPFRIYLLGHFQITRNERHMPLERWHRKASLTLLKLLAMRRGQSLHSDVLIEHLWPGAEPRQDRKRLKVVAYYARHELGSRTLLRHAGEGYALNPGEFWLDAAAFEAHVAAGVRLARSGKLDDAVAEWRDALALYRGDLLEENIYDDWCAEERERLRELYFDAAERLAAALRHRRQLNEVIEVCRRVLARADCREVFHRILMETLIDMGRLEEAELQYRQCRAVLARDLDVEPLPETRRVFARIQAARTARY